MDRSESILALAKLLNSHKKHVLIPVLRTISAKSIDLTEPKTQPTKEDKSFSKLKTKPASKSNWEPSTLSESEQQSKHFLEQVFLRNGYLRIRIRRKQENKKSLKSTKSKQSGKSLKLTKLKQSGKSLKLTKLKQSRKEYEIRLIPKDREELEMIRAAISELGLYVCNTFIKHDRIVQPIYGKEITLKFQNLTNNYHSNNLKNGT